MDLIIVGANMYKHQKKYLVEFMEEVKLESNTWNCKQDKLQL